MLVTMKTTALLLLGLAACGGGTAPEPTGHSASVSQSATLYVAPAGYAQTIAVACPSGMDVVGGSCGVSKGAALVEDHMAGDGWACGATTTIDGAVMLATAECESGWPLRP